MGEGINIYRAKAIRNKSNILNGDAVAKTTVENDISTPLLTAKQQKQLWFKEQPKRQKAIRKILRPLLGSVASVQTDEGVFDVEVNNNEVNHIAYDAAKIFTTEDSLALLEIPKYLKKAKYIEAKWDKDYDAATDTFHSTKSQNRRDFERFYYLKYPINGQMILFQVGRASDRMTDANKTRVLDENGRPKYHYYLHSIRKTK